jgi:hypothetical protein
MTTRPDFPVPSIVVAPALRSTTSARSPSKAVYVLVMLAVAMGLADVIARVFLTESPLGGAGGFLTFYAETAAIGIGLAVLRTIRAHRAAK